ncbi:hypothetical protein [Lacticaseibacillus rhamnosus]
MWSLQPEGSSRRGTAAR